MLIFKYLKRFYWNSILNGMKTLSAMIIKCVSRYELKMPYLKAYGHPSIFYYQVLLDNVWLRIIIALFYKGKFSLLHFSIYLSFFSTTFSMNGYLYNHTIKILLYFLFSTQNLSNTLSLHSLFLLLNENTQ